MQGVPIKFRGVRIDGSGYAYGDLKHEYNGREIWIDGCQVYPHTVAQLIGYDAASNELYEGDEVNVYHSFQASAANFAKSKKYDLGKVGLTATVEWFLRRDDLDSDDYQYLQRRLPLFEEV